MSELSNAEFPLVSVIIPAYNASKYISETIESVLLQTYPNIEILVVNDGSTDDTEAKTSTFENRIRYFVQDNSGVSAARNAGILSSRGVFVTCIDADDIMHPEKISVQVDFINKNPYIPIVFTDYINFSDNKISETSHFHTCQKLMDVLNMNCVGSILESEEALNILVEENFSIGSTPMFNKMALNKVGLYDSFLSQGEDFELHYRFAKHYAIGIIDKVMLYRRLHETNTTRKLSGLYKKAGMSRQKILQFEENENLRKKLNLWLQQLYLSIGNNECMINKKMSTIMTIYSLKYGFNFSFILNICRVIGKWDSNNK
jgi:glycosyltransferase involved in cell wall biosynthesis